MKNFNFKPFAVFALAAVLLSGCAGLSKMKKNADQIQFNVTPEVLETHAGEVDVDITGRFPAKYFNKKATLVATPVLKYEEGETALEPVTMQGEKVEANNKVISYNAGGSYSYSDAADFKNAMRKSELYVNITASKGSKSVDFEPIKIADGVIATSTLVANYPKPILGVRREHDAGAGGACGQDLARRLHRRAHGPHLLHRHAGAQRRRVGQAGGIDPCARHAGGGIHQGGRPHAAELFDQALHRLLQQSDARGMSLA